ncbi:MAG: hypothetical protein KF726_14280 [Anaerolineae bacterium]|nr:hypothetical protein [Anaerolineae bacterium]
MDETGYQLYYCHLCANSLDFDLFWGPEYAIPFVQKQHEVDADGWLNNQWAEGGVVIDMTRQVLILFGGEDATFGIPMRRMYLALLQQVWTGWQVKWAHNGVLDLVDYVQVPREKVRWARENDIYATSLMPPQELDLTNFIGSIILEDGITRLFPLGSFSLEIFIGAGPNLVEFARSAASYDDLPLDKWTKEFPEGGFHIDLPQRQMLYWAADEPMITLLVEQAWQGWETVWLGDAYEAHLERIPGRVALPTVDIEVLLARLEKILVHRPLRSDDQRVRLVDKAAQMKDEGYEVRNNEFALRDDPLQLDSATRRRIFDQAVTGWRQARY